MIYSRRSRVYIPGASMRHQRRALLRASLITLAGDILAAAGTLAATTMIAFILALL